MKISARLENAAGQQQLQVRTHQKRQVLAIPPKASGLGSSVRGGELLVAALATCYCNDIYREAAKRQIEVEQVEVEVEAEFGAEGDPAQQVTYRAKVTARASAEAIQALMVWTDQVAEIQNTLRVPTAVTLAHVEVQSVS
jgi:organic hydroperoxide reductase OsmC/OhrA